MPNVLIYIIDALRADHLSCYGYGRATSPAIDALAAEPGVVRFTRAYSPATWTKPVAASILSGCYPPAHGVRSRSDLFIRAVPRLPEILQAAGFSTAAVSTIGNVSSVLGFGIGFDHFVDLYKDPDLAREREVSNSGAWKLYFEQETTVVLPLAEDVNRQAMQWLAERARSETGPSTRNQSPNHPITQSPNHPITQSPSHPVTPSWFLFLWALDPHDPYYPPPGFDRWRDPGYTGPIDGSAESVRRVRTPADVQRLVDLYDGEIAYVDQQFGRLIDHLRASGQYDDTLIVLAGDHGEAFGEHGDFVHGHLAYEEIMHVPLLVKFPASMAVQGGAVDALAQLTDIAPTVLDALGLAHLADGMQGVSLLPVVRSPITQSFRDGSQSTSHPITSSSRSFVFSETQASPANNRLLAVRSERWKYLRVDPPGDYSGSGSSAGPASAQQRLTGYWQQLANPEMVKRLLRNPMFYLRRQMAQRQMLFDLAADPLERNNIASEQPAVLAELDAALEVWLAECRAYAELSDRQGVAGLDEATLAQLHGLGYL
ncbi:MAG: sulfatase [Anaerolineae bacterium]